MSTEKAKAPDDEGISLDELPTEDPRKAEEEAALRRVRAFKEVKQFELLQAQDVRARHLAKLAPEDKLQQMSKVYEFDKKEPRLLRLALLSVPVAIKHLALYDDLMRYLFQLRSAANFLLDMMIACLDHLALPVAYAEVLVVAGLLLWPPVRSTPLRFLISFEGIDLPRRLRIKSTDPEQRRRIKWAQIHSVKLNADYITALELFDQKGESLGMLRWDLWPWDKKSFEKIIAKYIGEKHPLRKFVIENG